MSIHIKAALEAIRSQAVNDANDREKSVIYIDDYRPFVEACVAAETAELRCQIAELKLANCQLTHENNLMKAFKP